MPRVSVVIPAFNASRYLSATLESVLASTFRDFEIVVINDGSTDDTAAIASRYDGPVRVVTQPNAGMSASRNRGVEISDSELIAFVDSDDIWHPEKLRLQIDTLTAGPQFGFSYTEFEFWDGSTRPGFATEPRHGHIDESRSGWIYHLLVVENWALPSSVMLRRSTWRQLGPFLCEDHQTDDWEYLVRASRTFQFVRLAEPMVLYRQHPASLSRRLPLTNGPELMRQALIRRFGLQSPDGTPVDMAELDRLRTLGWRNFADSHCARGDLQVGLAAFRRLLIQGPERALSLKKMAMSLARRVVPKRS